MAVVSPGVLVVHPSLPVKSAKELIAFAKARPGEFFFSSLGRGAGELSGRTPGGHHRAWMPARFTTSAHFFMSASWNWRNASGVLLTASEPLSLMILMNSGDFTRDTIAAWSLSSSGLGSFAGADTPYQP